MPDNQPSPVGVQARVSALDPATCRFRVTRSILAGGPVAFGPADAALVAGLEAMAGVAGAVAADNFVTVRKVGEAAWDALVPSLGHAIRAYVTDDYDAAERSVAPVGERDDEAVLAAAREAVEREFNPAIASHKGAIRVLGYEDGVLTVEMRGGCQGCAASQMTLSRGLRQLLARRVPEVREVVDATDHEAGTDPYYRA